MREKNAEVCSMNVIAIMGRLAADPQIRQTTTGKCVTGFTLAVDRGRKDANGQYQTDWVPCVAWGNQAEFICKYFQKGSMIALEGRLQSRQYQTKEGQNRTAIEVVVNSVNFCGGKSSTTTAATQTQQAAAGFAASAAPAYAAGPSDDGFATIEDEDDLPF